MVLEEAAALAASFAEGIRARSVAGGAAGTPTSPRNDSNNQMDSNAAATTTTSRSAAGSRNIIESREESSLYSGSSNGSRSANSSGSVTTVDCHGQFSSIDEIESSSASQEDGITLSKSAASYASGTSSVGGGSRRQRIIPMSNARTLTTLTRSPKPGSTHSSSNIDGTNDSSVTRTGGTSLTVPGLVPSSSFVASAAAVAAAGGNNSTNGDKPDIRIWLLQNQLSTLREEVQTFHSTMKNAVSDWKEKSQVDRETYQHKFARHETTWNTQFSSLSRQVQTAVSETKRYCRDELVKKQLAASELSIMGKVSNEHLLPLQEQYRELELAVQYQSNELRDSIGKQQVTVQNIEKTMNVRKVLLEGFERHLNTVSNESKTIQKEWKTMSSNINDTAVKVAETVTQLSDQWKEQQSHLVQRMTTNETTVHTLERTISTRFAELEDINSQIQEIMNTIGQTHDMHRELAAAHDDSRTKLEQYHSCREVAEEEFRSYIQDTMQSQLDQAVADCKQLQSAFSQYQIDKELETAELDQELDEKQEVLDTLQATVETQSKEIALMKTELAQAKIEREEVQKEIAKNMEMQNTLFDYLVSQVQTQAIEIKGTTTSLASMQQTLTATTTDLELKMDNRKQVTDRLLTTMKQHTMEIKELSDDRDEIRQVVKTNMEKNQEEFTSIHLIIDEKETSRSIVFDEHTARHNKLVEDIEHVRETQLGTIQIQLEQQGQDLSALQKVVTDNATYVDSNVKVSVDKLRDEMKSNYTEHVEQERVLVDRNETLNKEIEVIRQTIQDETKVRSETCTLLQNTIEQQIQPSLLEVQVKALQQDELLATVQVDIDSIHDTIGTIQSIQNDHEKHFMNEVEKRKSAINKLNESVQQQTKLLDQANTARVTMNKELESKMDVRHVMLQHLVKQVQQSSDDFTEYQHTVSGVHGQHMERMKSTTKQIEQMDQLVTTYVSEINTKIDKQGEVFMEQFTKHETARDVDKKVYSDSRKEIDKIFTTKQALFDQLVRQVTAIESEVHGTNERHIEMKRTVDTKFDVKATRIDTINEQIQQLVDYIHADKEQRTERENEILDIVQSENTSTRTELENLFTTKLQERCTQLANTKVSIESYQDTTQKYDMILDCIQKSIDEYRNDVVSVHQIVEERDIAAKESLTKSTDELSQLREALKEETSNQISKVQDQVSCCQENIIGIQNDIKTITQKQSESISLNDEGSTDIVVKMITSSCIKDEIDDIANKIDTHHSKFDEVTNHHDIHAGQIQAANDAIVLMQTSHEKTRQALTTSFEEIISTRIDHVARQVKETKEDVFNIQTKMEQYDTIEAKLMEHTKDCCNSVLEQVAQQSQQQIETVRSEIHKQNAETFTPLQDFQKYVSTFDDQMVAVHSTVDGKSAALRREMEDSMQVLSLQASTSRSLGDDVQSANDATAVATAKMIKLELKKSIGKHDSMIESLNKDLSAVKNTISQVQNKIGSDKERMDHGLRELEAKLTSQIDDISNKIESDIQLQNDTLYKDVNVRLESQVNAIEDLSKDWSSVKVTIDKLSTTITEDREDSKHAHQQQYEVIDSLTEQINAVTETLQEVQDKSEQFESLNADSSKCIEDIKTQVSDVSNKLQDQEDALSQNKQAIESITVSLSDGSERVPAIDAVSQERFMPEEQDQSRDIPSVTDDVPTQSADIAKELELLKQSVLVIQERTEEYSQQQQKLDDTAEQLDSFKSVVQEIQKRIDEDMEQRQNKDTVIHNMQNQLNNVEERSEEYTKQQKKWDDAAAQVESYKLLVQEIQKQIEEDKEQQQQKESVIHQLQNQLVQVQLVGHNNAGASSAKPRETPYDLSEVNSQESPLYENSSCFTDLIEKVNNLETLIDTLKLDVSNQKGVISGEEGEERSRGIDCDSEEDKEDVEDRRGDTLSGRSDVDQLEELTHQIELHAAELQMIRSDISNAFDMRDGQIQTLMNGLDNRSQQLDNISAQIEKVEEDMMQIQESSCQAQLQIQDIMENERLLNAQDSDKINGLVMQIDMVQNEILQMKSSQQERGSADGSVDDSYTIQIDSMMKQIEVLQTELVQIQQVQTQIQDDAKAERSTSATISQVEDILTQIKKVEDDVSNIQISSSTTQSQIKELGDRQNANEVIYERVDGVLTQLEKIENDIVQIQEALIETQGQIQTLVEKATSNTADRQRAMVTEDDDGFETIRTQNSTAHQSYGEMVQENKNKLLNLEEKSNQHDLSLQMINDLLSQKNGLADEDKEDILGKIDACNANVFAFMETVQETNDDFHNEMALIKLSVEEGATANANAQLDLLKDDVNMLRQSVNDAMQNNSMRLTSFEAKVKSQETTLQEAHDFFSDSNHARSIEKEDLRSKVDSCKLQINEFLESVQDMNILLNTEVKRIHDSFQGSQSEMKSEIDAEVTAIRVKVDHLETLTKKLETEMNDLATISEDTKNQLAVDGESRSSDLTQLRSSIDDKINQLDGYVNDIRDYIEDSMTKSEDVCEGPMLSETTFNEVIKKISTQLNELKKSQTKEQGDVSLPSREELAAWRVRLDKLETRVQAQAQEIRGARELREEAETRLEEKIVELRSVEKKFETTAELLKETKWENKGLRATLTGMQGQQEKKRLLHAQRIKGLLSDVPTPVMMTRSGPTSPRSTTSSREDEKP